MRNVSDGNSRTTPPRADELEVSLFGPGFGECVVIHLGRGAWLIIDSCIDVETGSPAPLDYLRLIGVDPATSVCQIIVTHWHDDHVGGLSAVFKACSNAEFICSDALREKEFLTLVAAYSKSRSSIGSGVDELGHVLAEMRKNTGDLRRFKFALADQCLWRGQRAAEEDCPVSSVYALAPSSYSCVLATVALGKLLPQAGPMRRVPALTPNHAAVALWVEHGNTAVLLGSDLEETGHPQAGWSAIVSSRTRPQGKAAIYKVAHHGSINGDVPDVWRILLESDPIAALAPFINGGAVLPQNSDIERICGRTTRAYATALPRIRRSPRRPAAVQKTIDEVARSIHPLSSSTGQVRIRMDRTKQGMEPRVELFAGALKLPPR